MIEAREAAQNTAKYYKEITGRQDDALSIEEVEWDDLGESWSISLGIMNSNTSDLVFLGGRTPKYNGYKVFKISANDGSVKSVKIRIIK